MTASIDPVALTIGSLQIRWYGLMYVVGFMLGWFLAHRKAPKLGWKPREVDDLLTICMIGCILGGRIGYVLFYDFAVYLRDPLEIIRFWNGGMSFHGAACGLCLSFAYFSRTRKCHFIDVADFVVPFVPQGLMFGRIGNFINGELWGAVTDAPWGVVFPGAGPYPRHPSQLYEAFLEGAVLWAILAWYSSKPRPRGHLAGVFAMGYGTFRFLVEFVRVPDAQLGYLAFGWLTMGQVLCMPLLIVGAWLFFARHELPPDTPRYPLAPRG